MLFNVNMINIYVTIPINIQCILEILSLKKWINAMSKLWALIIINKYDNFNILVFLLFNKSVCCLLSNNNNNPQDVPENGCHSRVVTEMSTVGLKGTS